MIDKKLLDSLLEIALGAGSKIMPHYKEILGSKSKGIEVSFKEDASPLTLADLDSDRFIRQELKKISTNIPIVSEEESDNHEAIQQDYFWLVDPLDGTREFISGSDEFTVNIALIKDHKPLLGIIYAPALDLLYWGSSFDGSYKKDSGKLEKLGQKKNIYVGPMRILASKSHMDKETEAFVGMHNPHVLKQAGSSLKFCYLAEGLADIYPRYGRTCGWDTAAGHAILKFSGGTVHDLEDNELSYGAGNKFNPAFIAKI